MTDRPRPSELDLTMARVISTLLARGVLIAASVLAAGLIALAVAGDPGYPVDGPHLIQMLRLSARPDPLLPHTFSEVLWQASLGRPVAIISLGVFILFATPVVRVATMLTLFARARRTALALIATAVLLVLLTSMSGGLPR